jgi:hypothetical protein
MSFAYPFFVERGETMGRMLAAIAIMALAQAAFAQERPAKAPAKEREQAKEEARSLAAPRPAVRVLQDPYDLASFYQSGGSAPGGWAGLADNPAYGIADFYRAQGGSSPYGWSRFWTSGYAARRPLPLAPYRRNIGENGDLFLVVPFLAPLGPISGALAGY